jgi:hypothetical protein
VNTVERSNCRCAGDPGHSVSASQARESGRSCPCSTSRASSCCTLTGGGGTGCAFTLTCRSPNISIVNASSVSGMVAPEKIGILAPSCLEYLLIESNDINNVNQTIC